MSVDRSEFTTRAYAALRRLDDAIGEIDDDRVDVELSADVLTITFDDGAKFVLNAHSAAGQIWLAAGSTAWHFDPLADGRFVASRTDDELADTVSRVLSDKLSRPIVVRL